MREVELVSPSVLAAESVGLDPIGSPAKEEKLCSLCGRHIAVGELYTRASYGSSFMDDASLACRSGAWCGHCAAISTAATMRLFQKGVYTREGAYSLAKDIHRAWFLLTPPKPPFVAVVSDTMLQHLVWRTPVTYSTELITVRLGGKILRIRHKKLMQAIDDCAEIAARIESNAKKDKPAKHPYASLSREAAGLDHGLLRNDIAIEDAARLWNLTPGEVWALATLAKRDTPVPEQPERIVRAAAIAEEI